MSKKKSILSAFSVEDVMSKSFNNQIINVPFEKIKPAHDNRDIGDISDLAEDIAENGLNSNLIVRKIDDPDYDYELIGGHRRYAAILYNAEQSIKNMEYIPCKVGTRSDDDAYVSLIMDNALVKPLTQIEILHAIERLKEIYKRKKSMGEKVPGRINHLIAEVVGLGSSQVANYEKVLNHAAPEILSEIEDKNMTINEAAELASLEKDDQLAFIKSTEDYDIESIKEYKEQLQEPETPAIEDYWNTIDKHINKSFEENNVLDKKNDEYDSDEFVLQDLQNILIKKLSTQVIISKNKLMIYFDDTRDLNRILDILNCLTEV